MKILFISHDARLYGATRSLLNLMQGIQHRYPSIEMHVLIPRTGILEKELSKLNIPYTIFPYHWTVSFYKEKPAWFHQVNRLVRNSIKKNIKQFPAFLKLIRTIDPDIIYSNTSVSSVGALAAFWLRKKHVWHIREFGWEDHRFLYDYGAKFHKWLYNRSALVIVISNAIQVSKLQGLRVPVRKIYNGVYFEKALVWEPRKITGKTNVVFGIIGGLRSGKGILDAMKAFSKVALKYPESRLIIAGGEEEYRIAALKELAGELSINNQVEFNGFIEDIEIIYRKIDVVLNCSRSEGLGRSMIEALAHGIPVISRNSGGATEVVKDRFNGLLFNTTDELADKMKELIESPEYSAYSGNAIKHVKEQFTIENYVDKVVGELQKIIL